MDYSFGDSVESPLLPGPGPKTGGRAGDASHSITTGGVVLAEVFDEVGGGVCGLAKLSGVVVGIGVKNEGKGVAPVEAP